MPAKLRRTTGTNFLTTSFPTHPFATTRLIKLTRGNCPKCKSNASSKRTIEKGQCKHGRLLCYYTLCDSSNVRSHRLNFDQEMGQLSTI
ncbi:hypothetical protein ALC56_10935 [Trachymyrmex septentrionalis]|uniref:Uncharacterized protein n=1 Tax=Trachymyrmex septentrionalis TaxID=34720 RepID=A0A195F1V3_9HYME|nr:hypothetical protein ALC56_10935 [Trachymyrmex septentrionalis]